MPLDVVLLALVVVEVLLLTVTSLLVVGPDRLRALGSQLPDRLRRRARPLALLAGVLLASGLLRDVAPDVSWMVGVRATSGIYAVEGDLVARLQSFATPELTAYFAFVYVFGYVFLLSFPLVAYLSLEDPRPLRELAVSYCANYLLGLACYVLVVA